MVRRDVRELFEERARPEGIWSGLHRVDAGAVRINGGEAGVNQRQDVAKTVRGSFEGASGEGALYLVNAWVSGTAVDPVCERGRRRLLARVQEFWPQGRWVAPGSSPRAPTDPDLPIYLGYVSSADPPHGDWCAQRVRSSCGLYSRTAHLLALHLTPAMLVRPSGLVGD
jgi:hypothetical protein